MRTRKSKHLFFLFHFHCGWYFYHENCNFTAEWTSHECQWQSVTNARCISFCVILFFFLFHSFDFIGANDHIIRKPNASFQSKSIWKSPRIATNRIRKRNIGNIDKHLDQVVSCAFATFRTQSFPLKITTNGVQRFHIGCCCRFRICHHRPTAPRSRHTSLRFTISTFFFSLSIFSWARMPVLLASKMCCRCQFSEIFKRKEKAGKTQRTRRRFMSYICTNGKPLWRSVSMENVQKQKHFLVVRPLEFLHETG